MESVCLHLDGAPVETRLNKIHIGEVHKNRQATTTTTMSTNKIVNGIQQSRGFTWDEEDATTTKWRPQGISSFHHDLDQRYVLISWYGRQDEGYAHLGGRISFVDITQMNRCISSSQCLFPYVHVLLVDVNVCTFPNIHVGGIEQVNHTLYVADSRKGMQQILQFDLLNGLYEVPSNMIDGMFGHRYILRQSGSFPSPIKPSFLSYDFDNDRFVIGTYARCGSKVGIHLDTTSCFGQSENRLVWLDSKLNVSDSTFACGHYFSEMQGAVSARVNDHTILWVSSSYGPIADSHLHVVNLTNFIGDCSLKQLDDALALDSIAIYKHPPGLEDLHIEQLGEDRLLWMTNEFGIRMVFASSLSDVLP